MWHDRGLPQPQTTALEHELQQAHADAAFARVTTIALERYGPEILGFLASRSRSESDTAEIFSVFLEDFWRGLPGFRWSCSLRGWAYTLARNAANRYFKAPGQRPGRIVPLSDAPAVQNVAERVKTSTLVYLRSEVKSEMRLLREQLSEEDQTVLILRVDKQMPWRDIAAVMINAEPADDAVVVDLDAECARLRKRFQLAKQRLRVLASEHGLIDAD